MDVYLKKNAPKKKRNHKNPKSLKTRKAQTTVDMHRPANLKNRSVIDMSKGMLIAPNISESTPELFDSLLAETMYNSAKHNLRYDLNREIEVHDVTQRKAQTSEEHKSTTDISQIKELDLSTLENLTEAPFEQTAALLQYHDSDDKEKISVFPYYSFIPESRSEEGRFSKKTLKSKAINVQELYRASVPRPTNTLEKLCRKCQFLSFNEPRIGKRLVVLDLDLLLYYFEPEQTNYNKPEPRPLINDFLSSIYVYYNIAIWVKTSMEVLFYKLDCLKIFAQRRSYKLSFCLDNSAMTYSYIPRLGNPKFKPLEVIWSFYPQFNSINTILIDDQLHKFYFNKRLEVQVRHSQEIGFIRDPELMTLSNYLVNSAKSGQDFTKINLRLTNAYAVNL